MRRLVVQVQWHSEGYHTVVDIPVTLDASKDVRCMSYNLRCQRSIKDSRTRLSDDRIPCYGIQRHLLLHPVSAHQYTLCFLHPPPPGQCLEETLRLTTAGYRKFYVLY